MRNNAVDIKYIFIFVDGGRLDKLLIIKIAG